MSESSRDAHHLHLPVWRLRARWPVARIAQAWAASSRPAAAASHPHDAGRDVGEVVTREELRERIWGTRTHVDFDRAINKAITRLRQLLGDHAARPRFIETLPKRGYRFVADVARLPSRHEIREDAREAYLKARHFWNKRTPDDVRRSIEYFHRAIERDPDYALSWTGLADAYLTIAIFGLQPPGDVGPSSQGRR